MTHAKEDTFDAAVERYIATLYPGAEVDYQVYLPSSGRYCDFVVTRETPDSVPDLTYAVETEDDFDGVIASVGQAAMYAGHFERGVPVVAYPVDHVQQPELANLRRQTRVLLLEVPREYWEAET